ncbi:17532_t:CDS:2 [Funneliformis geosporum]|uniref:17532_t:CDS:1 n=1 Tax=Funneliformis geosporum TaxID=1117311 RepID=A0A9W4SC69_9GLOM|nr:17532_t:CDS:2 [Funneliformis geosporum]
MFRDSQWVDQKSKQKKTKRKHIDSTISDNSSTNSKISQRSDNEMDTNSQEFYDPLPPSDSKELRNIEGGEYFLPSADKNIERLQMQHFLFRCIWQSNYSAPVEEFFESSGAKVLDVQCGSGVWMSDLAIEFPNSTFVGVDDDADRARIEIQLPNAAFLHHNIKDGLPFPDDTFDFVHQRFFTSVSEVDWRKYMLLDMIRVLKPGGLIELMEMSPLDNVDDKFNLSKEIYQLNPSGFQQALKSTKLIKSIESEYRITPLFGGRASQLVCQNIFKRFETKKKEFCEFLNLNESELDENLEKMREEVITHNTFWFTEKRYELPSIYMIKIES